MDQLAPKLPQKAYAVDHGIGVQKIFLLCLLVFYLPCFFVVIF